MLKHQVAQPDPGTAGDCGGAPAGMAGGRTRVCAVPAERRCLPPRFACTSAQCRLVCLFCRSHPACAPCPTPPPCCRPLAAPSPQELKLQYGSAKGKAYTEEEDRFLVSQINLWLYACLGVARACCYPLPAALPPRLPAAPWRPEARRCKWHRSPLRVPLLPSPRSASSTHIIVVRPDRCA